jgi:hypothetical protein
MVFWVVNHRQAPAAAGEILFVTDGWNDRFLWVTQFFVTVVNNLGERIDVGEANRTRGHGKGKGARLVHGDPQTSRYAIEPLRVGDSAMSWLMVKSLSGRIL